MPKNSVRPERVLEYMLLTLLTEHPAGIDTDSAYRAISQTYRFPEDWFTPNNESSGYRKAKKMGLDIRRMSPDERAALGPTEPKWENRLRQVRRHLKDRQLLDPAGGRGIWRLTPAGLRAAKDLSTDGLRPEELAIIGTARGQRPRSGRAGVPDDNALWERRRSRVQGHEPDPAVRRAIEQWAMAKAEEHYRGKGFKVENTSTTEPYDFRCTREGLEVRVEVKGTRGDGAAIEVTIGEVENARDTGWRTDLFVVSAIEIERTAEGPVAHGGNVRHIKAWRPTDAELKAIRFRCVVPAE